MIKNCKITNAENRSDIQDITSLASVCVKCGICLQSCPTYQITLNENESPRGRIALMQALAENEIKPTKKAYEHLDNCLGCRTCERVCPSGVKYDKLYNKTLTLLRNEDETRTSSRSWQQKLLTMTLRSRKKLNLSHGVLRFIEASGLRALASNMGLIKLLGLKPYVQLLPTDIHKRPGFESLKSFYPINAPKRKGAVGLFIGCFSSWIDIQTSLDTIYVLNRLGYEVYVPPSQGCCGALSKHQGDSQTAKQLSTLNENAFQNMPITHIVSTSSGCLASMKDESFMYPVVEVCQFILQQIETLNLTLPNMPAVTQSIALHTPCTMLNVLRTYKDTQTLLERFNIRYESLESPYTCCGAAGSYMLEKPHFAQVFKKPLIENINKKGFKTLCTSNIGCAMHLGSDLKNVQIFHPISLIAQQLSKNIDFTS